MGPEQLAAGAAALLARGDELRGCRAWRDARDAYEQAVAAEPHNAAAWEISSCGGFHA